MLRVLCVGLFLGNVVVYGALAHIWLEFKPYGMKTLYKSELRPQSSVVTDAMWRPLPQWI